MKAFSQLVKIICIRDKTWGTFAVLPCTKNYTKETVTFSWLGKSNILMSLDYINDN